MSRHWILDYYSLVSVYGVVTDCIFVYMRWIRGQSDDVSLSIGATFFSPFQPYHWLLLLVPFIPNSYKLIHHLISLSSSLPINTSPSTWNLSSLLQQSCCMWCMYKYGCLWYIVVHNSCCMIISRWDSWLTLIKSRITKQKKLSKDIYSIFNQWLFPSFQRMQLIVCRLILTHYNLNCLFIHYQLISI